MNLVAYLKTKTRLSIQMPYALINAVYGVRKSQIPKSGFINDSTHLRPNRYVECHGEPQEILRVICEKAIAYNHRRALLFEQLDPNHVAWEKIFVRTLEVHNGNQIVQVFDLTSSLPVKAQPK